MKKRLWTFLLVALLGFFVQLGEATLAWSSTAFVDPLDTPAAAIGGTLHPQSQPMLAAARAGERIVAVGLRGTIVWSDDNGGKWHQASVPVQSDIVAVMFVDPQNGWASGHDGVILHTTDAGSHWTRQFDYRSEATTFANYYRTQPGASATTLKPILDEIALNTSNGASLPWLSVWFDDKSSGYAVGSFGMIARTQDGGKSWIPWFDHIDNDQFLNLNAIRRIGDQLYIAGEKGMVYRFDPKTQRFVGLSTGYEGSLFDIVGDSHYLLAIGLRGRVFRSIDQGATWVQVPSGTGATLTGATRLIDGRIVLASGDGALFESADEGQTFHRFDVAQAAPLAGVTEGNRGDAVVYGYGGVRVRPNKSGRAD